MTNPDERRNRVIYAWHAAWDRGDLGPLEELLSPDYRRFGSDHTHDLAEFKASIIATRASFPDLRTVIDEIVVEGDSAAIRWHSVGRHERSYFGVPATRREVSVSGSTFARFENDRVIEEHVTWDPRALLAALGILIVGQD